MVIHRTNPKTLRPVDGRSPAEPAEACFRAMQRHAEGKEPRRITIAVTAPAETAIPVQIKPGAGDIIYGAKAIARYLFDDDGNRSRRRVFNLWNHYRDRKERAGFFKLKGALCLSKSQWQDFHGLG